MRKIEKIIFALMSILFLGAVLVSWVSNFQKQNPVETEESDAQAKPSYTVTGSLKIPDYFTFGEEDAYVVSEDFVVVGKDYILTSEEKSISFGDLTYQEKGEYLKIAYKKIDDPNAKTNIVNLSEIANSYKKGYHLKTIGYILHYAGSDFLIFFLQNGYEPNDERYDSFPLAYQLDEGRLSDFSGALSAIDINSEGFFPNGDYKHSLFEAVRTTTLYDELNSKGFDARFNVMFYSNESNETALNLFAENPDLKAQLENGKNVFIYPRYDGVTPEKWFNQILHWFAPVGEETLTTYMKTGSDTIKSTPITSYADYLSLKGQVDAE